MSASLVGSEMCIRDRCARSRGSRMLAASQLLGALGLASLTGPLARSHLGACLLYTSDAADDM
eukprot:774345-Alexandrium_andersonii.AAC.1